MHLETALGLPPDCLDTGAPLTAAQAKELRDRLKARPDSGGHGEARWPASPAAAAAPASSKGAAATRQTEAARGKPRAAVPKPARKRSAGAPTATGGVTREVMLAALKTANRQAYGPRGGPGEDAELTELRRANLTNALQARGAKRFLADRLKVNPSRISLYLDRAAIPEEFLRAAESALLLQARTLDAEPKLPALEEVAAHVTQVIAGETTKVLELPKGTKVVKGHAPAPKEPPAPAPQPTAPAVPATAVQAQAPAARQARPVEPPEVPAGEAAHVLRRIHNKLDVAFSKGALSAEQAWELLDKVDSILEMNIQLGR